MKDVLPPLPVPRLRDTLERLLESLRPLLPSDDLIAASGLVATAASAGGEGERLQRLLVERADSLRGRGSWLEEWWEKEALRCREPLPISSNW